MAGITVTGDQYREIDRKLEEVKRQLRQPSGYPFDLEELNIHLQAAVEGRFGSGKLSIPVFSHDMTEEGWTLVEDVGKLHIGETTKLEFVPILRRDYESILHREMRDRAKELGCNLGQLDAEYLLAHPNKIPISRGFSYWLAFPGTVWRVQVSELCVPCLVWSDGRWRLNFPSSENYWHSFSRFVRPRK